MGRNWAAATGHLVGIPGTASLKRSGWNRPAGPSVCFRQDGKTAMSDPNKPEPTSAERPQADEVVSASRSRLDNDRSSEDEFNKNDPVGRQPNSPRVGSASESGTDDDDVDETSAGGLQYPDDLSSRSGNPS